jgi:TPR repeat protein/transglutaminase-like putative cysteine protease
MRLAEAQYWAGPKPAYLVNRAIQVNSPSKISELGQFSISFVPSYQKLVIHRIAILRGNQVLDRTMSANVRVLDSEGEAAQGYYLGTSAAQVLLEDVKSGDTLWTTYSVEGANPVFGSTWSEHLPWTKDVPVEVRKAVVLYPATKSIQWRVSGAARPKLPMPSVEQRNGVTKLVFREEAVAAEEFEPSMPPDLVPLSVLDITEYKNWGEVAQWAVNLFPHVASRPEVQALARKFEGRTIEERASLALHWVQDEIRYFSVSMGENSHRPQPPEVVLKRRFGDCKDKSQLLVALYRAMGLEAQPVLVHSTAPKLPAQFQPSPGRFNHVIVRVVLDGKPYFVDPTLQDERGFISSLAVPEPGAAGLVVSSDTTALITLPEESMSEPLVNRTERLTIPQLHGEGQLQLHLEYRGRFATAMRQLYRSLSSSELKKLVLGQFERTYPDVQLNGNPKFSDGNGGGSFIVEAQLTIPKVLTEENGSFQLAQRSHILEGTLGMPDKLVRKYPFWLAAGKYRARYSLDVSLPSEARLSKDDDRLLVQTSFFEARGQLTWRGAQLNYYVDYAINKPEVAPAALPALMKDVDKLSPLFESKLRFKAVKVPPQAAKAASLRVLDIMQKLSGFEDLQAEAIKTGKIPELNFGEGDYAKLNYRALCETVLDNYSIRQWNPVIRAPMVALYKLVDARADKRTKDLCMARQNIVGHGLPQASKELAALAPADDDPLTLMQAWADFHAQEGARARVNLSRYLQAKARTGVLTADDAFLALALTRRLGEKEPDEVRQLVDSFRTEAWPMPLFSFLRGKMSADELLATAERVPSAAREFAAMEAHFAVSQQYLAANQPRKADVHLNWFARYGILGSAFEVLADADQYGATRADPDMLEFWKLQRERGSASSIIRHLEAAAQKGLAEGQSVLGSRYLEGVGVRQDLVKAQGLLEAAAAKGNSNAMHDLGLLYGESAYGKNDQKRAIEYFQQSAENGNRFAGYVLGRAFWYAEHAQPFDFDRAFRHMKDAAELEHETAQFFLSRMYYEGKGTDKNDSLALFWAGQSHLRKDSDGTAYWGLLLFLLETDNALRQYGLQVLMNKANAGNSMALLEVGKLLIDGKGVNADPKKAYIFLQRAHLDGHERATAVLGRMYVEGLGVDVNVSKGLGMLADLEKRGIPDAFYQLGRIYRSDTGGMTDKVKAAEYFRRGAEKGQREAAEALAVMLHTGEGIRCDLSSAATYYEEAVKSGFPRAMNNLADMYEKGNGVEQNLSKAMDLYRRAAQIGHPSAMLNLAEIYEASQQGKNRPFLPLAYYMLANKFGLADANEGLGRVKSIADPATIEKAHSFVSTWKPGKAMPEES